MKLIKSIALVLSLGWITFLMAYAYGASASELTILFIGLTGITYIFAKKGEKE